MSSTNSNGRYDSVAQQVVYQGSSRHIWRRGDLIFKVDPERLDSEWLSKMELLLPIVELGAWAGFHENGYRTHFIDGTDLQGNRPFEMDGSKSAVILSKSQRLSVLSIFGDAIQAGRLMGYTFGDITCGNILTDGKQCFLIDYDVIVPWPLPESHVQIWSNTLKLLFGEDNETLPPTND